MESDSSNNSGNDNSKSGLAQTYSSGLVSNRGDGQDISNIYFERGAGDRESLSFENDPRGSFQNPANESATLGASIGDHTDADTAQSVNKYGAGTNIFARKKAREHKRAHGLSRMRRR